MNNKITLSLIVAILLSGCATNSLSEKELALVKSKLRTKKAVESYQVNYVDAEFHKAWARSKSGAAAWVADRFTEDDAIEQALTTCRDINKKREKKHPCKIINLNGEWID